jgi:hypothetical protein
VKATTRGKARYRVAFAAAEAGYGTVGEGLRKATKLRRAPDYDDAPTIGNGPSGLVPNTWHPTARPGQDRLP